MIAFIRGNLVEIGESTVTVESGGIGYQIYVTGRDAGQMKAGREILLHTYFHVREDAMQLFGFLSRDDLSVFKLLLGINGIGPKAAIGILTALSANDLRFAVLADDVKTISAAPGVGKKTAQKMILELKDKFDLQYAFEERLAQTSAQPAVSEEADGRDDAVQALVALGYPASEALKAVRAAAAEADDVSAEDLLRAALKHMSF